MVIYQDYTENGYVIITRKLDLFVSSPYDTMAFRKKLDGTPDIDRCLKTYFCMDADKAYMNLLECWELFNRGEYVQD